MLDFKTALQKVLDSVPQPSPVEASLKDCLGYVLAEEVLADHDLPPFDKAFMDGYALQSADTARIPVRLEVIGTQPAGRPDPSLRIRSGCAVRIMTGAPLPAGADAVQMIEKTREESSNQVEILESVARGSHIAPRGSEVRESDRVLEKGQVLDPSRIAVLATVGKSRVNIFRPLRVAVWATGDELVDVERSPQPGQIRNSNGPMLADQCRRLGASVTLMPCLKDEPEEVRQALRSLPGFEVGIFSGGVSAGQFDYVHRVLGEAGLEVLFHKVAIKPGKPILVAAGEGRLVFGLPGNPVSTFVTFELFVRAALRRWMGFSAIHLPQVSSRLLSRARQKPGRLFFKPARTHFDPSLGYVSQPLETRGSADIVAFSQADSFIIMEAEDAELLEGQTAQVLLLPDHHPGHEEFFRCDSVT